MAEPLENQIRLLEKQVLAGMAIETALRNKIAGLEEENEVLAKETLRALDSSGDSNDI